MVESKRSGTRYERLWHRVRRNFMLVLLAVVVAALVTALFQCGAAIDSIPG
jgi:ABC-type microcin C transport system permease subunit YejB